MKEVKWWNFDKCSQQIGQQISNPQRDQNKEESVNMDSGALGTLNQKVEHKANKNSLRFNGSVCTIGENKRTHQMNPYIWKKCLMVRWRIVQGEADMRPKEKNCIFHLVRKWCPLKTQPIIIVNPINKVNIKRRRTGNRKRKLYGYFLPSKATLLFLLYSAFLILLFLFKRKKQAKIIYNHRLSVSTVHLFSLTTAECVRVFVFEERQAGTIMYQWNNLMYKTRILFSNKFYCLCYNPAWKCS